jgi:23S rRNA (uracil1939-C5)-methyltransferase
VERVSKQTVWARAVEVLEPSGDRREPPHDPACGGAAFAHIAYARQRVLKQQILVDAFHRLARLDIEPPTVAASPEAGYRVRARLHVSNGRAGFFREGTHALCDAAATRQLLPEATAAAAAALASLGRAASACEAIVIAENVAATERVIHIEPRPDARIGEGWDALAHAWPAGLRGVSGVTAMVHGELRAIGGAPTVTDRAGSLFGEDPPIDAGISWTRRAPTFFQANRFLIGSLVRSVLSAARAARVADLYAGAGMFAVALAARGSRVLAVEGEPLASADLVRNAEPFGDALEVRRAGVEDVLGVAPTDRPDVILVDPPRTGLSQTALSGVIAWSPPRVAYVSCDPPTLARDARHLVGAGYRLTSLEAFDLFPNTPHVEALAVFDRAETSQ